MTLRRKRLEEQSNPLGSSAASSWMNISPGCSKINPKKPYRKQGVDNNLLMAQTAGRGTKAVLGTAWLSPARESLPEPQENNSNAEANLIFISLPLAKLLIPQTELLKVELLCWDPKFGWAIPTVFVHFSLLIAL